MDRIAIGKRVRRTRESHSMTRDEYSEYVGISSQFLAEIENGKKGMSAETIYKICQSENASADYILFGKITTDRAHSPLISRLCDIGPEYSDFIEEIIHNILKMIERLKKKNLEKGS